MKLEKFPACLLATVFMLCIRLTKGFRTSETVTRTRNFVQPERRLSPLFSTTSKNNNAVPKPKREKAKDTGGLRRLPVVKSPVELMNKARREAQRVKADTYVPFCKFAKLASYST